MRTLLTWINLFTFYMIFIKYHILHGDLFTKEGKGFLTVDFYQQKRN